MGYTNLCRVCESAEDLEMIFKEESTKIVHMLRHFTPNPIYINDGLPQYVCPACAQQLRNAYNFKSMYEYSTERLLHEQGIPLVKALSRTNCHKMEQMEIVKTENVANGPSAVKSSETEEDMQEVYIVAAESDTFDSSISIKEESHEIVSGLRRSTDDQQMNSSNGWSIDGWCIEEVAEPNCSGLNTLPKEKVGLRYEKNTQDIEQQNLANKDGSDDDYVEVYVISEPDPEKERIKCTKCGKKFTDKSGSRKQSSVGRENVCDKCAKPKKPKCNEAIYSNSEHSQAKLYTREKYEKPLGASEFYRMNELLHSNFNIFNTDIVDKSFPISQIRSDPKIVNLNTKSGKYKCEECGKFFNKRPTYKNHLALHLNPNRYRCDICGKLYSVAHRLKVHKATHLNPDMYKCEICGKAFAELQRVKTHEALHSNPDLYKCKECGTCFSQLHTYRNHLAVHLNPDLYKCDICGQIFTAAFTLKEHKIKHANPDLFKCDECGKTYTTARNLNSHKVSHTGRDPYKCQECGKSFSQLPTYKNHLALHSNPDLHKCEICGKSFTVAHRLKSHRVMHYNPDLYKCEVCGKSFTESYLLKDHKAVHSNPDLYKCDECGKAFNQIWYLRDHKALHSDPNVYTCKECGRSFANSYYMRRHMKRHAELDCENNLTIATQDIPVQEHPPLIVAISTS